MPQTQAKSKRPKKETKPKPLNVAFVWDMSGSMQGIDTATREGTRGYLMDLITDERKLIEDHGESIYTRISITAFDTVFEPWLDNESVLDVDVDSIINRYQPRGMTALYDAIANTITTLDSSAAGRKGEKFLVVVMTDGGENSSREYGIHADGKNRLFQLIKKYEKRGNWTFVYLGAGVEAYNEAVNVGFAAGNTISYSATPASAKGTSSVVSNMTSTLRGSSAGASINLVADAGESLDLRDEDEKKLWTPTNVQEPK